MASVKVKYRPSSIGCHEGTVYYQVIHQRKVRHLSSPYHVRPDEWDEMRSMVTPGTDLTRRQFILSVREDIVREVERLGRIIRKLDNSGSAYDVEDVTDAFRRYRNECSVRAYMGSLIVTLRRNGKARTAETYTAALHSLSRFLGETSLSIKTGKCDDIMLDALTSDIMEAYEAWHRRRGNSQNTISFYTRILRAVYNHAVENNLIEDHKPFRRVYTGIDKTVKRALPLPVIKLIRHMDLSADPSLDYARDMFVMSFMLRGMSFIDMCYLRKSDLRNGSVIYRRRKTGQQLTIAWTPEMQTLLDKYPPNPTPYLLPIIRKPDINERWVYKNIGHKINFHLKEIGRRAGVTVPLTLYVARHSWASAAKTKGVPLAVISEGMGHDSETTTQIYLASLDSSRVDKANSIILESI